MRLTKRIRQFYTLSKSHHPDHNPHDPQASQRFIKISEAYATLGNPLKRERYDKDIGRAQVGRSQSTPRGSHSSASTPFGSRPASGLSRRRTQFKGPPPSYYRNGGWGSHSAKRQAQAEGFSDSHRDGNAARSTSTGGGADPGTHQSGFGNDVPHFDQDAHYRTQQSQEQRWIRRKSNQGKEYSHEGADVILMFLIIGGVVCAAFSVPIWVMGPNSSKIKDEMPHP